MATPAHCLYCFETLAAHLENRKSMTLEEVQKSFADYLRFTRDDEADDDKAAKNPTKRLPALQRLAHSSSSSSSSGAASPASSSSTTSLQQAQAQSQSSPQPPPPGTGGTDTPNTSVSSLEPAAAVVGADELDESPLFVTWNILQGRHGYNLRGCIGTFEPLPLEEGLSSYALTSALHDTRFHPVAAKELPLLEVAVTLLTDFESADDAMDWVLGTHGLRLSFHYHGRRYGSTYLPDVAPEQGWTQEETIVSLMRKAGWMGRKDKWHEVDLKVVRYQGRKESLEYADFKRWRDWVDSQ